MTGSKWATILVVIAVGALGLSAGVLYRAMAHAEAGVFMEPAELTLVDDPLEPAVVKINLRLVNRGSTPIRITSATASCGCMTLVTQNGDVLSEPVDVAALGSIPWQVSIRTEGRIGRQSFWVTVNFDRQGSSGYTMSKIYANVRPGWRAYPEDLIAGDVEAGILSVRDVTVYDAYPDPGIAVKEITSTNPSAVQGQLIPNDGSFSQDEWDTIGRDPRLRKRFTIRVKLTPPNEAASLAEECIALVPESPKQQALIIPVIYSLRKPKYGFVPEKLVIVLSPLNTGKIVRTVTCNFRDGVNAGLRVVSSPSYSKISLHELAIGSRAVRIELAPPTAGVPSPAEIVFAEGRDPTPVARLPVTFVRTDAVGRSALPELGQPARNVVSPDSRGFDTQSSR
jgi:hypothetical protein